MFFYRSHDDNFSKNNTELFYNEFKDWYNEQEILSENNFNLNKKYFKKLLSLEINHLLFNKNRDVNLLSKFFYPNYIEKIKYLIAFFTPKIIIKYLKK